MFKPGHIVQTTKFYTNKPILVVGITPTNLHGYYLDTSEFLYASMETGNYEFYEHELTTDHLLIYENLKNGIAERKFHHQYAIPEINLNQTIPEPYVKQANILITPTMPVTRDNTEETIMSNSQTPQIGTLFQTIESGKTKPRYGTFLTIDSKGRYVLEMKGKGGEIEPFESETVVEVVPYTVEVRAANGSFYDFKVTEGSVEVNDMLIDSGSTFIVCILDTKKNNSRSFSERARKMSSTLLNK